MEPMNCAQYIMLFVQESLGIRCYFEFCLGEVDSRKSGWDLENLGVGGENEGESKWMWREKKGKLGKFGGVGKRIESDGVRRVGVEEKRDKVGKFE